MSAVIYGAVGYHVFHQRNQLRNLTLSNQADIYGNDFDSAEKVRFVPPPLDMPVTLTCDFHDVRAKQAISP
jgi:hypothetical protein